MFRKINLAIILFSLLIFSSCKKEHPIIELPFTFENHIIIPMVFNGDTIPFIFDTGSTRSHLNKIYCEKAKLVSTDSVDTNSPVKGLKRYAFHRNVKFKIGSEFILVKKLVQSDDFPPFIGMDVISQFHWLFDMKKNKVLLSRGPISSTSPKIESLKISYDININGTLTTFINIGDSINYNFLIDSGHLKSKNPNGSVTNGSIEIEPDILIYSKQLMNYLSKNRNNISVVSPNSGITQIHQELNLYNSILKYIVIIPDYAPNVDHDARITARFFALYDQVYINPKEQYIEFIRTDRTTNESTKLIQDFYHLLKQKQQLKNDPISTTKL